MNLTDTQIQVMVAGYLKNIIERIKQPKPPAATQDNFFTIPDQFENVGSYIGYLKRLQAECKLDRAVGDYRGVELYAKQLLEESGIPTWTQKTLSMQNYVFRS